MDAVLLIGHGSLHRGSGVAMIRLAARLREAGIAPLTGAGFLNYSQPRFRIALDRLVQHGATRLVVLPYFLVPGKFVRDDLARAVQAAQQQYPDRSIRLAEPFGCHEALAELVLKRASVDHQARGLMLLVHGSPHPESNEPVYELAALIEQRSHFERVGVAFLDLNAPLIGPAIDAWIAAGLTQIVAVPYFLQLGGHVREDLPAAIQAAQARHPQAIITLTEHLGYDRALIRVLADRAFPPAPSYRV